MQVFLGFFDVSLAAPILPDSWIKFVIHQMRLGGDMRTPRRRSGARIIGDGRPLLIPPGAGVTSRAELVAAISEDDTVRTSRAVTAHRGLTAPPSRSVTDDCVHLSLAAFEYLVGGAPVRL